MIHDALGVELLCRSPPHIRPVHCLSLHNGIQIHRQRPLVLFRFHALPSWWQPVNDDARFACPYERGSRPDAPDELASLDEPEPPLLLESGPLDDGPELEEPSLVDPLEDPGALDDPELPELPEDALLADTSEAKIEELEEALVPVDAPGS